MESPFGRDIVFETCNSSKARQKWVILKTENDRNNIRLCQRRDYPYSITHYPYNITHSCLIAYSDPIPLNVYQMLVGPNKPIKPNNEARYPFLEGYYEPKKNQEWQMNSTTNQLVNVQYPKGCLTHKHFSDNYYKNGLVVECNGYGYESPNPQLNKNQRFYPKPALDKNGKQLCDD